MSSSVASADANSVSNSAASLPSSPGSGVVPMLSVEYTTPTPATQLVEPQNPFDRIEPCASGSSDLSVSSLVHTPARGTITSPDQQVAKSLMSPPTTPMISNTPPRMVGAAGTPVSSPMLTRVVFPANLTATQPVRVSNDATTIPLQGQLSSSYPITTDSSTTDDDENTASTSAANTADRMAQTNSETVGLSSQNHHHAYTNSFSRFWENARRRLSSAHRDSDDEDENIQTKGVIISGYLQKLGRNGKWQTRWFECDGECLSYYKTEKRSKLLATLDLQKVGLIEIDGDDAKECSFRIQVLGRLYHLRADSRASCKDWVITLNRVKEARMQQGNVKLVGNSIRIADLLDQSHSQNSTPRVVVVANRQRTRAVDEDDQWPEMIHQVSEDPADPAYITQKRHSALSSVVVARWSKRRSALQRLSAKVSKWARSLKKYSCAELDKESVYLDQHVHPPGHDDSKAKEKGTRSWSQGETTANSQPAPVHGPGDMTRPGSLKERTVSVSSEYDARMIS